MNDRSRLLSITIRNLGCIGPQGLTVQLDDIVCLVGRNNTGKSTILRAYELAQSSKALGEKDRCQWTPDGEFPEVELSVHIPEGIENVDEKWKSTEGDLRIVRSRWQWKSSAKPERQTWNPELNEGAGEWDSDEKAGGADNVFNSRLPKPLRIDALKDSVGEHDILMKLVLEPIAKELELLKGTEGSDLKKALEAVAESIREPVAAYQEEIDQVGKRIGSGITGVFPNLSINIKIGIDTPDLDATKALIEGSKIRFIEGTADTELRQQGAGSRRALFWSLLQVRSEITRRKEAEAERVKNLQRLVASLEKEQKKAKPKQDLIEGYSAQIEAAKAETIDSSATGTFPGYILLIDEPENCLHPMAVRAARNYLYGLAKDGNWQVMLSTHSPYFINPLEDHTTIVRLERDGLSTTPRTFRADTAEFSADERLNLRALLQLDSSLSEMFFGSYPVLVEGDTELAAFIPAIVEKGHPLSTQMTIVNARGKALLCPLIKLLAHFSVPFGVLHDSDYPTRSDGGKNSAWSENEKIADYVSDARKTQLEVRHRVSIPDFERFLELPEGGKDKPVVVYRAVSDSKELQAVVVELFSNLNSSPRMHPVGNLMANASASDVASAIGDKVRDWAAQYAPGDPRFSFPDEEGPQVVGTILGA
jgi:ABC-type branched-subunit amino acid transport system ATPase component